MIEGKYKAYPEYKDSGVEWLGDIPTTWNSQSIKRFSKIFNGATPKSVESSFWDGDIAWVTPADIGKEDSPYIEAGARSITQNGYDSCGTSLVPEGTIILSSRAPIGTIGIAAKELCTNQGCKSIIVDDNFYSKYLFYTLSCSSVQLNILGKGTTFLELSSEELSSYKIGVPSSHEQIQIANFLDHETVKIDTLIGKQKQLIKLLKEKRQAVISHAVTKGLNPDAPLHDSGVEWLGEVPEHWDMVPLKFITTIKYGIGEPPKYQDEGIPLIRATNIRSGDISSINLVFVNPSDIPENRIIWLETGDIIVVRSGAGTGDSSIIPEEYDGSIAGFDMVVRPVSISPDFLGHLLLSDYVRRNQIDLEKMRAAQPHLNAEELGECFVLVPPMDEQKNITKYIECKLMVFDNIIEKAKSGISLLQERRTALISAAVTGKIDVRDWKEPQDSSEARLTTSP